jgi:hypothetical protein
MDKHFASVFAPSTKVYAEFAEGDGVAQYPIIAWAVRNIVDEEEGEPTLQYTEVVGLVVIAGLPSLVAVDDDECGGKFVQYVHG